MHRPWFPPPFISFCSAPSSSLRLWKLFSPATQSSSLVQHFSKLPRHLSGFALLNTLLCFICCHNVSCLSLLTDLGWSSEHSIIAASITVQTGLLKWMLLSCGYYYSPPEILHLLQHTLHRSSCHRTIMPREGRVRKGNGHISGRMG